MAARVVPTLLALLGVLVLSPATASGATVPCPRDGGVRCLTVTVPLDRSGAVPGTIRLRAARLRSRRASRAPLVALSGGPGQAGVAFASTFAETVRTPGRDLVVLDQRGTGASGLLRCPAFERRLAVSFATPAGACGRSLGPRRAFYTSADSAEDIEALRVRLRAPALALYGVSYGTKVALEYAGRYPQRVERLLLDSPVPLGGSDVFARETFAAVPRVIRAACSYGCGGADGRPVSDLRQLAQRLRRTPIRRRVNRRGRRVPVRVDADDLLGLLVTGDLLPPFLQDIPRAVRDALAGRTGRIARLKLEARRIDEVGPVREFAPALFAATLCEESPVAWDRAADTATRRGQATAALAAIPQSAFAPFDRAAARDAGLLSLCVDWPAPGRAAPPDAPLPTGIPTLVLSGELDLRTPLESARRLAASLPGARVLMERGVGHSVLGADPDGCAGPAARAFLLGRTLPRCARR